MAGNKEYSWKWAIFIAFFAACLWYLHNDLYIDFADEGFLWYGTGQVLKGQVPIRDFQSYEPGRYYWCAAVFSLAGPGLMNLRLAAGLFQGLGIFLGLLALRRVSTHPLFLLFSGLWMAAWMLIPCRYFDASLAMFALYFALRLVEQPMPRRFAAAGAVTGLAAFFGWNHGLYFFASFSGLSVYLALKGELRSAPRAYLFYLAGLAAGILPFVAMSAFIPGFADSLWERMKILVSNYRQDRMNVSFPVPWPWSVSWERISDTLPTFTARSLEFMNRLSTGFLFVFVALYYLGALFLLTRLKARPGARALFTASVFVGYFYVGHIFARSDVNYLGEGIFPVWAGLLALAGFARPGLKKLAWGLVAAVAVAGLLSAGLLSTVTFKNFVSKKAMTWYPVGSDRIWVTHEDARYIERVKELVAAHVEPGEPLLLAPLLTTFYCLLDRESPVYQLYFHIAPSREREEEWVLELEEKNVRWAIVADLLVDGRPEQALSRTHPLLWGYLMGRFERVTSEGLRPGYSLMRRKL